MKCLTSLIFHPLWIHGSKISTCKKKKRLCLQSLSKALESATRLSAEPEDNEAPPAKCLKGLAAVLKHIEQEEGHSAHSSDMLTSSLRIEREISSYLEFPAVESDTDGLAWWKREQGQFPNLAYLAKKYL